MSRLFETVKVLHVEPTDVCQAACPSCAREIDSTFDKKSRHSLTLNDFQNIVPRPVINQLDKLFMCGNYGDPAANEESKNILAYVNSVNSNIVLGMNTNGALQNANWWQSLASILSKPRDYVVFSIDGLEDTNHIYRKNVNWNKLMTNAAAFIAAGGNAQWDMLVYEHNEHQVDQCEQLARSMGFKWFRAKVSKRVPTVDWLKPPKNWTRPIIEQGPVNCFRNNDQSLYLSAKGIFYPCCWLGHGTDTIEQFDNIVSSWDTPMCNPVCKQTCSTVNNVSNFTSQWQREVELC